MLVGFILAAIPRSLEMAPEISIQTQLNELPRYRMTQSRNIHQTTLLEIQKEAQKMVTRKNGIVFPASQTSHCNMSTNPPTQPFTSASTPEHNNE
jgi:hypothetical protein